MKDAAHIRIEEFSDNPSDRVPICLVLDISSSMSGEKINELNDSIEQFFEAVRADEMARISVEVAIVTFGSSVQQETKFSNILNQRIPKLVANGNTPMGRAVTKGLDLLEQEKRIYAAQNMGYYQPWLVLMTDGEATDDITAAAKRCQDLIKARKLTLFPIAIGRNANLECLSQFSPNIEPLRMESADLKRFFKWLSASSTAVSSTNAGDSASASAGETEFKRFRMSMHDAMKTNNRNKKL